MNKLKIMEQLDRIENLLRASKTPGLGASYLLFHKQVYGPLPPAGYWSKKKFGKEGLYLNILN